ncbi:MAG TPA: trimeric intracellular cation channel family protein [Methylomirabilota bacterium]
MSGSTGSAADQAARLLVALDLAGVFVFALEGALAAMAAELDLLGVMVLAFATALAGGVIRDLLIGAVPPMAIRDWHYSVVAFVAAGLAFVLHGLVAQVPGTALMVLDAAGLSLFAMAGTEKALDYGIHQFIAMMMGAITGVGGGVVRDLLLAQVPAVLRTDVYATAALAGSVVMIGSRKVSMSPRMAAVLGGICCFVLRVVSVWQHWNLPRVSERALGH